MGFPLILLFQVFVARRDIRELWVRTAPKVILSRLAITLALALAVFPVVMVIKALVDGDPASVPLAFLVIAAGAAPAAYAYGRFAPETWRYLALASLLMIGYMVATSWIFEGEKVFTHPLEEHPGHDFWVFVISLLQYIPTVFVFEEVVFRGGLDSHLHHPGDKHRWWTAAYISLLWCLWHAPMFGWDEADNLIVAMLVPGIVLSIFWRKSGNLGVTGGAHALNDSIRNAFWGVP
jgi:membrane protease YdiL (CAAX protease family)